MHGTPASKGLSMTATETMACLLCPGDHEVEVCDLPVQDPGPGEIRIRTVASAICGSDLHFYRAPSEGRDGQIVLGHEGAGIVDAVGPGVVHPKIGDRVVAYPMCGCGHCRHCHRGEPMFCNDIAILGKHRHGTDAAYLTLPARYGLDFEMGALLGCNVGTAYGALQKTGIAGGTTLAIIGLGPVGLYCTMLGRAMGADIVGVDLQPERLELGKAAGATTTLRGDDPDLMDRIRAFADGEGVHASIDTTGVVGGRATAINALRVHGRYVEVGLGADPTIRLDAQLFRTEVTLQGSWLYKLDEWGPLLQFLRRTEVPIKSLVTERFRIDAASPAFELAAAATTGKILFDWS